MKKIIVSFLVIALFFSFIGCNSKTINVKEVSNDSDVFEQEVLPDLENKRLKTIRMSENQWEV